MKTILFFPLLFFVVLLPAQQTPYFPLDNFAPTSGTATITAPFGMVTPTSTSTPVYVSQTAQVNFVAGLRLDLRPGFSAGAFAGNGYFHGQIGATPDFDVAFIQPNQNTPQVEQYEKLEMGIQLPQQLFNDVEAFCNHTQNYLTPVNPFNPEELNVYAEFYKVLPNNSEQFFAKVFGFYYREFQRVETGPHVDWDWSQVATNYTFRIRFAPPETGLWRVIIKVESPTRGNYQVGEMQFSCVVTTNPNNKGFVKTLPGKRYLELGDKSFMPIGWNITNPGILDGNDHRFGTGQYGGWNPINEYGYVNFGNFIQDLSSAGGNYFRLHTDPWALEIEFEKLNDYTNRLSNAWEMDRILDEAKNLNLYIHFTLFGGNSVVKGGNSYWDWADNDSLAGDLANGGPVDNGYCYHTQLGLINPSEFLTDPIAKKFFKYRLRYMISRYGYSRNVAVLELANEVNNFCKEYSIDGNNDELSYPYGNDANFRLAIFDWQSEMTSFIKTQLYSTNHILSVNYANYPIASDNSFGLPTTDLNTFNYYDAYLSRIGHYFEFQDRYGFQTYARPFFFSETGEPSRDVCSNFTEWIRTFWTVPFSGAAGGLNWPKTSLPENISFYPHFARMQDYISELDFNDGSWISDYQLENGNLVETIHIKHLNQDQLNNHFDKAIGVVVNRTFNAYSMRTCNSCDCANYTPITGDHYIDDPQSSLYFPVQDVEFTGGIGDKLKVTEMGSFNHYSIEWMDVMTGSTFQVDDKFSQLDGDLILEYPTLIMETTPIRPIVAFKIYPFNSTFRIASPFVEQEPPSLIFDFSIYPIPASNILTISPLFETSAYNIELTDLSGKVIFLSSDDTGVQSIDVSVLADGVYFVSIISREFVKQKKIIIAKQ